MQPVHSSSPQVAPFGGLPPELVLAVIEFTLPVSTDPETPPWEKVRRSVQLGRLRLVSKVWNHLIEPTPSLWARLDNFSSPAWQALCTRRSRDHRLDIEWWMITQEGFPAPSNAMEPSFGRWRSLSIHGSAVWAAEWPVAAGRLALLSKLSLSAVWIRPTMRLVQNSPITSLSIHAGYHSTLPDMFALLDAIETVRTTLSELSINHCQLLTNDVYVASSFASTTRAITLPRLRSLVLTDLSWDVISLLLRILKHPSATTYDIRPNVFPHFQFPGIDWVSRKLHNYTRPQLQLRLEMIESREDEEVLSIQVRGLPDPVFKFAWYISGDRASIAEGMKIYKRTFPEGSEITITWDDVFEMSSELQPPLLEWVGHLVTDIRFPFEKGNTAGDLYSVVQRVLSEHGLAALPRLKGIEVPRIESCGALPSNLLNVLERRNIRCTHTLE